MKLSSSEDFNKNMDLVAPHSSAKSAQPAPLMYELIEQAFAPPTVARRWRKRLVRRLKPR